MMTMHFRRFAETNLTDFAGPEGKTITMALALAPAAREQGRYWEIPQDAYPKMEQAGVILSRAKNADAAREFRAFLMSDAARHTLKSYGFY